MTLSNRLQTLLELTPRCSLLADIGADHAHLTIEVLKRKKAPHVLCTDLSGPSLDKARRAVEQVGLCSEVTFCLGDGLRAIEGHSPEVTVIAGMGGETIASILEAVNETDGSLYLLQPMSKASALRAFLSSHGFGILDERLAEDDGRIYPILCAKKCSTPPLSSLEIYCGKAHLTREGDPLTARYLSRLSASLTQRRDGRKTAGAPTDEEDRLLDALAPYLDPQPEEL